MGSIAKVDISSSVFNGLTSGMTDADMMTVSILDEVLYHDKKQQMLLYFSTIDVDSNSESNHSPKYYLIWVFHDRRFCQIIWQIYTQGRAKKFVKNCPQWGLKQGPPDLQANALPTELSQHSVASLNLHGLYKVMLY